MDAYEKHQEIAKPIQSSKTAGGWKDFADKYVLLAGIERTDMFS